MRLPLILSLLALAPPSVAQTIYWGPTPYLSEADIPAGFYAGPYLVETFEDESLDLGITADFGWKISPGGITDSVDGDDGIIDGSGNGGATWFYAGAPITFTFARTVTEAAVVWTDGPSGTTTSFEAFGPGMVSLGLFGPFQHADDNFHGGTAEDRFYGVTDPNGIVAIRIMSNDGNQSIEVDHVQFTGLVDPYCSPAVQNSTGLPARIAAQGSLTVADGDLELYVDQVPAGEFGYFLVGTAQGSVTPPGSNGVLCLGGDIGRFHSPSQVIQGPGGNLLLDLSSIPVNPPAPVLPGDTYQFQCWYRDAGASNFTDAVSMTFQ